METHNKSMYHKPINH